MTLTLSGSSPIVTAPPTPEDGAMESQSMAPPRLVRRREGRMIAGVCKGLAEHFRVEPTLVRIGFVVATFFGGAGIIGYAAAWAFIPDEGEQTSIGERI